MLCLFRYTVEPQLVDIGPMLFDRASEKDITVHNKGKVKFAYDVDTTSLSRPGICEVSTKSGVVLPGQHAIIKLKVSLCNLCISWSAPHYSHLLLQATNCTLHSQLCSALCLLALAKIMAWVSCYNHGSWKLVRLHG